jgi:hypothetical protein
MQKSWANIIKHGDKRKEGMVDWAREGGGLGEGKLDWVRREGGLGEGGKMDP